MPKPTDFHIAMEAALAGLAPRVVTLEETGSTNEDAAALAREDAPDGAVVVANVQTAGRGRLRREWIAERGSALLASWIVRPHLSVGSWTVIPLLAGVACAEAVRARAQVNAVLKWPNDLMVGNRKLGGILVEAEGPAFVVVGVGINVSQTRFPAELEATSIALEGGLRLDRADLLAAILRHFGAAIQDPDGALKRYRSLCATIGSRVKVEMATGSVTGRALDVDARGALSVETARGQVFVAAGDVIHLDATPLPPASDAC